MIYLTNLITSFDVFRDPFRHDVAGAFKSVFGVLDAFFLVDIFFSESVYVIAVLCHDEFGERLKSFLTSYLGLCLAFRFVRKIKVFNIL